jgi:hypothetical protein
MKGNHSRVRLRIDLDVFDGDAWVDFVVAPCFPLNEEVMIGVKVYD